MGTKAAYRNRRKEARAAALVAIQGMSDCDLKNLKHELSREMALQARKVDDFRQRLEAIRLEIQRRDTSTPAGVQISDHALVRYMQRVKGIDMDAMRAEIGEMASRARKDRNGLHGSRIDEISGLTLGVDETSDTITTIYGDHDATVMTVN